MYSLVKTSAPPKPGACNSVLASFLNMFLSNELLARI